MIGTLRKAADRASNGTAAGVVDVVRVDLAHRRGPDADGDGRLADLARQALPVRLGDTLRVVDTGDGPAIGRHDDGTCDDGAREGAPSNFIDSGEQRTMRGA